jgi:hypothetical protein
MTSLRKNDTAERGDEDDDQRRRAPDSEENKTDECYSEIPWCLDRTRPERV